MRQIYCRCGTFGRNRLIVKRAGCEISKIFEEKGEAYFRDLEAAVIAEEAAQLTGVIIATGGGAVLRAENVKNLKKNGKLISALS